MLAFLRDGGRASGPGVKDVRTIESAPWGYPYSAFTTPTPAASQYVERDHSAGLPPTLFTSSTTL
jgi:hypothetical protein